MIIASCINVQLAFDGDDDDDDDDADYDGDDAHR